LALTPFQREVCRLLAQNRIAIGESYVAGGAALNAILAQPRLSRDIDVFHDSREAVANAWNADRETLLSAGFRVQVLTERPTYVEAVVEREGDRLLMQWVEDSAYRYFPLVEHPDFGLALHPFDLATNKVLALVGRLEVRDWVDVMGCSASLQPLGYLMWAASGKDPGLSPEHILSEAARSSRYTQEEVATLDFEGPAPDAGSLSRAWHSILEEAKAIVALLPGEHAGAAVLDISFNLLRARSAELRQLLDSGRVQFHEPVLRGAFPTVREAP